MGRGLSGAFLLVAVSFALCSCQLNRSGRAAQRDGERQLASGNYVAAVGEFRQAAALSSDPETRARALVGLGEAQMLAGDYAGSIETLHQVRRVYARDGLGSKAYRLIGEAHMDSGEFTIAARYLLDGLPGSGPLRERTLAYAAFCLRQTNPKEAARVRRQLADPNSPSIRNIIDGVSTRMQRALARAEANERRKVARPRPRAERSPPPRQPQAWRPAPTPPIKSRSAWGARAPKSNISVMREKTKITIHHSAGDAFWEHSSVATADHIRRIQRHHQYNRRWADIGYHFIIDRAGTVWQGRSLRFQGAHAGGHANAGNIGIVVLGNYSRNRQMPRRQQEIALKSLVAYLADHYDILARNIFTHKELSSTHTACPGPTLTRVVRKIRADLVGRRRARSGRLSLRSQDFPRRFGK